MNFYSASCPSACQLQNHDLKAVWNDLAESPRQGLVILSVTFDPEVDTSQVLKKYAEAWGFDVAGWYFLTGSSDEIVRVTGEYGVSYQLVPASDHTHDDGSEHRHDRSFSQMNQAFLSDQGGNLQRQYLGIQFDGQALPIEDVQEDIRALLGVAH